MTTTKTRTMIAIPHHADPKRHAQDASFKHYFGLPSTAKWPRDGIQDAQGATRDVWVGGSYGRVRLWVQPVQFDHIPTSYRLLPMHRVMSQCPRCGTVMSAGRLQQHCSSAHN